MVHLNTSIGSPPEHDEVDPAFVEVWVRNLPAIRERVCTLEHAAEAVRRNEPIEAARDAAHKLAGSLGSFGLAHGSELARELEKRFDPEGDPGDPREVARLVAELRAVIER